MAVLCGFSVFSWGRGTPTRIPTQSGDGLRIDDAGRVLLHHQGSAPAAFDTISQANSASAAGDKITIPAGTFYFSGTLTNVTLSGAGNSTIITNDSGYLRLTGESCAENFYYISKSGSYGMVVSAATNATVKNVVIDAGASDHGILILGENNTLENCTIVCDGSAHGVAVKGWGHTLKNCSVDLSGAGSGNCYIIKADAAQSISNITKNITLQNCSAKDGGYGLYVQAYEAGSIVSNLTIELACDDCTYPLIVNSINASGYAEVSGGVLSAKKYTTIYTSTGSGTEVNKAALKGNISFSNSLGLSDNAPRVVNKLIRVKDVPYASTWEKYAVSGQYLYYATSNSIPYLSDGYFVDDTNVANEVMYIVDHGTAATNDDVFAGTISGDTWIKCENPKTPTPTTPTISGYLVFGYPICSMSAASGFKLRAKVELTSYISGVEVFILDKLFHSDTSFPSLKTIYALETDASTGDFVDLDTVYTSSSEVWFYAEFNKTSGDTFAVYENYTSAIITGWHQRFGATHYYTGTPITKTEIK